MVHGDDMPGQVVSDLTGGQLLRDLRQRAGLSLMDLAGRLDEQGLPIDASHLQRIETGRIAHPTAETVEAILIEGLDAPYRVRRDVLEAFGYRLPWALPTEREVADGRRLCAHELQAATWPAYLMDYGHRLWVWNRYVPRLMGFPPDNPAPDRFVGLTILDVVFDPTVGINAHIANPDEFLPLMLQMTKLQLQPHANEPWVAELLARARTWPGFATLWDGLPDDADRIVANQPIIPLAFQVPGIAPPLHFRMILVYLGLDPRFQMVHCIPYGAHTLRQVAEWAEEDNVW